MRLLLVALVIGSIGCKRRHEEPPPAPPPPPKKDPGIEQRRKAAVAAARKVEAIDLQDFSGAPCDAAAPEAPRLLGDMHLSWTSDIPGGPGDQTYGYLLTWWRFTGSELDVVAREGLDTPFEHDAFDDVKATLIIDRYLDPYFETEKSYRPGEIEGRVLVWKDGALACGAKVRVQNAQITVVTSTSADYSRSSREDPLSKGRIDLVNEAFRAGLAMLRKPVPGRPDCAHAAASKVALIDLRGVPPAKIADTTIFDAVDKRLAKESPTQRLWLFAGDTFTPWQKDSYATGIARWKQLVTNHPAAADEIVIDRRIANNQVFVERLLDAGLAERRPATLCEAGAERDVLSLARPGSGLRVTVVANP